MIEYNKYERWKRSDIHTNYVQRNRTKSVFKNVIGIILLQGHRRKCASTFPKQEYLKLWIKRITSVLGKKSTKLSVYTGKFAEI